MNNHRNKRAGGYVSFVMVLSLGITVLAMLIMVYKGSVRAQQTQAETGLRIDYAQKEEAILRAIVNIAPVRAMRAMHDNSDHSSTTRDSLSWQAIFSEALNQANARESVSADVQSQFGLGDATVANAGDTPFSNVGAVFDAIEPESGYVAPGMGRSLGLGYPPPLEANDPTLASRDRVYPIISDEKHYGTLASGQVGLPTDEFPQFNLLPYPEIRFGYAEPGQPFVAKRNWWAFSLDLADADDHMTGMDKFERDFIVSIYEVPSQLAIDAEAFTVLGKHADGTTWQNATVDGRVFSTRARVEEGMVLGGIAGRRGIELSPDATIDGGSFDSNPFAPGAREQFEIATGSFMPVSLASESGRAAFVPINRGVDFFDRHSHAPEDQMISPTGWDAYTVGALQCAMRLDVSDVVSDTDSRPTELTFQYYSGGSRETMEIPLDSNPVAGLPPGYIYCCMEDETVVFDSEVDIAYGANGNFYFQENASGSVTFDNARFGDPDVGTLKAGYYRPSYPFSFILLHDTKYCIEVKPELFPDFLELIGADDVNVNHSLVVNVDYPGNAKLTKPQIPCTDLDYGLVLRGCNDLSAFGKGFSLVTNLRLYIADDFNNVEVPPPAGSSIPTPYYPPCSLFAPEKRYGGDMNPYHLTVSGQMGSLAGDAGQTVHLLDVKMASGQDVGHDQVEVNLAPILHPGALPPVTMMNWLVLVEERRGEFYEGSQAP